MSDILLATIPGKHFRHLKNQLIEEFETYVSTNFIEQQLNAYIADLLRIVNLVELEDFQLRLLNRSDGILAFIDGRSDAFVKFSNQSETVTRQRIDKPLPYVGRIRIEILKDLIVFISKSAEGFKIAFNESVKTHFVSFQINRNLRKQVLNSIEVTSDSFTYRFKNQVEGQPGVIVEVDLNLEQDIEAAVEMSMQIMEPEVAKSICSKDCFESEGGNKREVILAQKFCDVDNSPFRVDFVIEEDNKEIFLSISEIEHAFVKSIKTDQPDIYSARKWPIERNWGGKTIRTKFNKGSYRLVPEMISNNLKYQFRLKVYELVDT